VADGMGGMAAGDVASNIVIGAMAPLDEDVPGDALVDALRASVDTANQQLRDTVDANPHLEGMGTTLTATLFSGSKIGMVHIGDSRAYMLRDGEFAQITKDDTYVQMLVDEGRISAEEASSHPQRSLLTRALDGRDIDPEYSVRQVLPGDRYLICSDGLSGVVSAETIAETLREYVDPQQCVERLVQLALRGGGPDNITVVVADATDEDIVESTPVVGGAAARDRGMSTTAHESTPAARASALTSTPRPAHPDVPASAVPVGREDDGDRPRRRPVRTAVLLLVLLGLLAGGLWLGWYWTQSQYYVGATDEGKVAVFQGMPGQIAGLDLSSIHQASDTDITDLTSVAQERVRQGIQARSESDAQRTLAELISEDPANPNRKPDCPTPTPTPTPTATPTTPATPRTTGTPSAGAPGGSAVTSASTSPTPTDTVPPVVDPAGCNQQD